MAEAAGGERLSVGAPWFDRVSAPFFAALLFLLGVGPALPWGSVSWPAIRDRFVLPAVAGVGFMVLGVVPASAAAPP